MSNDADIEWAVYTGDRAPIRSDNPIWCAWHYNQALFATEVRSEPTTWATAVCGKTEIGAFTLDKAKTAVWKFAEESLSMTICSRAHIMNFRKPA